MSSSTNASKKQSVLQENEPGVVHLIDPSALELNSTQYLTASPPVPMDMSIARSRRSSVDLATSPKTR
jgi:hypothetical protein